jgi:hypothetical protein
MQIEIKGRTLRVKRKLGRALVTMGRARETRTYETRVEVPEPVPAVEEEQEISERTGKPKRQYRRRDMQAETGED